MIDHNHFICHFIFGGHLLNIPIQFPRESHIAHTPLTLTRTAHRLQNGETSTASAIPSHSQNLIRHTV